MQVSTGARRASSLLAALVAMAVALMALAPASPAAGSPKAHAEQQHTQTHSIALAHVAGWTAGPVARGTGYHRREGSRRVREVQRRLSRLGYAPGTADGRFGPRTAQATRRYQQHRGLTVDGIVGRRTLAALRADSAGRRAVADWTAGPVSQGTGYHRAGGSERVREVQWDLRRLGYATGAVDGLLGPRTAAAVRRFQRRHALAPDGRVDAPVLAALRDRVPHATSPIATSEPAPAAPASPPAGTTPQVRLPDADEAPSLPLVVISLALAALGVLTVAAAYGRTGHQIRSAQREAELRATASRGLPAPSDQHDGVDPRRAANGRARPLSAAPARDGEEGR